MSWLEYTPEEQAAMDAEAVEARVARLAETGDTLMKRHTRYFVPLQDTYDAPMRVHVDDTVEERRLDAKVAAGELKEITYAQYTERNAEERRTTGHTWKVYVTSEDNQRLLAWAKAHNTAPGMALSYMAHVFLRDGEDTAR